MTENKPHGMDKRALLLIVVIIIMMVIAMAGVVINMNKNNNVEKTMDFDYVGAYVETTENGTQVKVKFSGNTSIYDVIIDAKNDEKEYQYTEKDIMLNNSETLTIYLNRFVDEDMDVWITIKDMKYNYSEKQQWRSASSSGND